MKGAKACPFCGSRHLSFEDIGGVSYLLVKCEGCGAEGPHEKEAEARTAAIERWNRRQ